MSGWQRWLRRRATRARLRALDDRVRARERQAGDLAAVRPGPMLAPSSMVWYGLCTYWTDDWSTLGRTAHDIPCCPRCGAVGFQAPASEWWAGAARFEEEGNDGYQEWLAGYYQVCAGRGVTTAELWESTQ
jgi:hypothetical protein